MNVLTDLNEQAVKTERLDMTKRLAMSFTLITLLALTPTFAGHHEKSQDIVDTAVAAGSFNTLVAAVQAAGLVDALKADGPLTVFAPTDDAFAKLPAGTVESLLLPENIDQLQAILKYHVVAGKVMASDVADGASVATLQGSSLGFKVSDASVTVNNATITAVDVKASNGVIHVIDTVLLPQ